MPVVHHMMGRPWNKYSSMSLCYKFYKWKKLKSQEQFWKWFVIGGALRSAFIVTGTSPFTSLRWKHHSASLWGSGDSLWLREVWRQAVGLVLVSICALSSVQLLVRVSFAQPEGDRTANCFWHFKYAKRHQLWGGLVFFLLQLYYNYALKCTYKHFIT